MDAEKDNTVLEDVVLLDVAGMHCASCSGRVRRLLEAQQHVTAATVSLTTETALVRINIPPLQATSAGQGGGNLLPLASLPMSFMIAQSTEVQNAHGVEPG